MKIKDIIGESTIFSESAKLDDTERFYNLKEWKKRCKELGLHVVDHGQIAGAPKGQKMFYAGNGTSPEADTIGGRFWVQGQYGSGEGHISGYLSSVSEDASAGATSSGAIASIFTPIGTMVRRNPLIGKGIYPEKTKKKKTK